jgi:hypothetical protein
MKQEEKMSGACRAHGRDEKYTYFWLESLERKRSRPRIGWKDNTKIYLKGTELESMG